MKYLALSLAALALLAAGASAQGIVFERVIIEPPPPTPPARLPLRLKEHRVEIHVEDQVARTDIVQVFHNPNPWPMEGVYLFPLPTGAAVSGFTMSMGGKQVTGEILDARRARDIYRSIVHRRRDPGLLEYAGRGAIRASLFPIPARGDTKVTLQFSQVLEAESGMIEYAYPLRTDRFTVGTVGVSLQLDVRAEAGVANLFSPTHQLHVVRKSETHVIASFEESASRGDRDFRLLYGLGRKDFGVALTSHKPAAEDGYFLLLVAPNTTFRQGEVLPKDIVFVLDTSGSMGDRGGRKLEQAKAALGYALGRLGPRDRFNVIAFSTEARPFRETILDATKENVAAALEHVKGLEATGGTAIHDALVRALDLERDPGRVPIVIFLTDGRPTIGPSETDAVLGAAQQANRAGARVFVFGVGDDVNTELLTELAEANRGSENYVAEGEDIELKVSSLYDKVASPVLTDVSVRIDGAGVHDVHPRQVGDLFRGQQLVLVGRYGTAGPRAITLSGRIGAREVDFVYEATFRGDAGQPFLPRLWAVRRVGFLLGEIRKHGEQAELVDEVRRLGTRHGIVTPYTSFLVVEEEELLRRRLTDLAPGGGEGGAPGAPELRSRLRETLRALEEAKLEAEDAGAAYGDGLVAGKKAVAGARMKVRYADADREVDAVGVKIVGAKTFRLDDGVWIDVELEAFAKSHPDAPVKRIAYLSEAYDACLENDSLARYLSVGANVRLLFEGTIYEISE